MTGSVKIKTRPLRLAYLVDPSSPAQIREAIRLSSSLWGGTYFPIVPLYKRMPATWADKPFKRPPAKSVVLGYLEAFDPDVLVQLAKEVPQFVTDSGCEIIKGADIWQVLETPRPRAPKFGIGIYEILGDIFERCFRYKAKYPVRVILPDLPHKLSLFWASIFGEIHPDLMPILDAQFRQPLEIEDVAFAPDKLATMMARDVLFPRRIAQWALTPTSRAGFREHGRVFFLDAANPDDIVDFWNLRALGGDIIALPKQLQTNPMLTDLAVSFLRDHRRPWTHNPQVSDFASIIRSRSCTMDEMQKFASTLSIDRRPDDPSSSPFFSLQHWYPRIWDPWARDKDGAAPDDLYTDDEASYDIGDSTGQNVRVKSALPSFAEKYAYHDEPRCANDVSFRLYGSAEYVAEVFPTPAGEEVVRAVGGLASLRREWRIDRSGLVRLVKHDSDETLRIPLAEDLMVAWLSDLGWAPKLSPPGILAKQIYRQLEGGLFPLHNEKLLGLLEHMNGGTVQRDGGPISGGTVRPELDRDLPVGDVKSRLATSTGGGSYDYLVTKGVFKLGIRIQCPQCLRGSWHSLRVVEDSLTCPRCLGAFPAIGNLSSGKWTYKTSGPFSVAGYADGAYAVLLTLEFFSERKMHLDTTPLVSFKAETPQKKDLEADFGVLWRESVYGEQMDGAAFGECKTYGEFDARDFDRMRYLAKTFPGSVLVFSTLRKSLTPREIANITRIAKAGRKYWKPERPINPVLVLTGTELLDWQGPPYCWGEDLRKRFDHAHGLLRVCDATQQIYLKLPSWQAEWHQKWEDKRRRRAAKLGPQATS